MARSYQQFCGLAAALDVLGERWTMLVMRELALGPKRFRDLGEALPGMGTNLLSARLKSLEAAGVVRRDTLAPPVGVQVYVLTQRGREVVPALEALARWGLRFLPAEIGDATFRASWPALCMRSGVTTDKAAGVAGLYGFTVDGDRFHVRASGDGIEVLDGPPPVPADVEVRCDVSSYFALSVRAVDAAGAIAAGAEIDGDAARLDALLAVFHLPQPAAMSA